MKILEHTVKTKNYQ